MDVGLHGWGCPPPGTAGHCTKGTLFTRGLCISSQPFFIVFAQNLPKVFALTGYSILSCSGSKNLFVLSVSSHTMLGTVVCLIDVCTLTLLFHAFLFNQKCKTTVLDSPFLASERFPLQRFSLGGLFSCLFFD